MFNFDAIRTATAAAINGSAEISPEANEGDARKQAIADHIGRNFGCNQAAVRRLVELMEGELPPTNEEETTMPKIGTAIVLENDTHLVVGLVNGGPDVSAPYLDSDGALEGYTLSASGETDWEYANKRMIDDLEKRFAA